MKGQEAHIVRQSNEVFKISWHEPTGTNVSVNGEPRRATHARGNLLSTVDRARTAEDRRLPERSSRIDAAVSGRWPDLSIVLVDEFATITFIEDCGRDNEDVIACGPSDLPPGYAARRN